MQKNPQLYDFPQRIFLKAQCRVVCSIKGGSSCSWLLGSLGLLRVWLGLIGFARGILSAVLHGVAQGWSAASGLMLLLVMFECNAVLLLLLLMKSFCPRWNTIPTRTIIQGGWVSSLFSLS